MSTIALVLKRHGLVKKRRRVRRIRETHPIFEAKAPNEIWSVDFKGKFRMGDGRYCYPLTVMDAYSRYVLAVVGMHQPTYEGTKAVFEALFKKYGLPKQIHSDNGEPFASGGEPLAADAAGGVVHGSGDPAGLLRPGAPRAERQSRADARGAEGGGHQAARLQPGPAAAQV